MKEDSNDFSQLILWYCATFAKGKNVKIATKDFSLCLFLFFSYKRLNLDRQEAELFGFIIDF